MTRFLGDPAFHARLIAEVLRSYPPPLSVRVQIVGQPELLTGEITEVFVCYDCGEIAEPSVRFVGNSVDHIHIAEIQILERILESED